MPAARAIAAAVTKAGVHLTEGSCVHSPAVAGCPPCAEVALRLALAEVEELRADFAV